MFFIAILSVIMLSVISAVLCFYCYSQCRYSECHQCCYVERRFADVVNTVFLLLGSAANCMSTMQCFYYQA